MTEKLLLEKKEKEDVITKLRSHEIDLKKTENAFSDSAEKCQTLSSQLEERSSEISRLNNERTELLAQIEAGEGVNEAIQQLKSENTLLQEKLEESAQSGMTKGSTLTQPRHVKGHSRSILLNVDPHQALKDTV